MWRDKSQKLTIVIMQKIKYLPMITSMNQQLNSSLLTSRLISKKNELIKINIHCILSLLYGSRSNIKRHHNES